MRTAQRKIATTVPSRFGVQNRQNEQAVLQQMGDKRMTIRDRVRRGVLKNVRGCEINAMRSEGECWF
jgi:hypothetical protein